VMLDHNKIDQVINNLLSNALKYSRKEPRIIFSCRTAGAQVEVSVRDYCIGIPQDKLGQVFQRFYRVEEKVTSAISGFGIGLYLSREIIQRHGSKIWVESEYGIDLLLYAPFG